MTYLGDYWTQGNTRFSNATIASYVQQIASVNGTVSLDVRLDQWGTISQSQKDQLNYIGSYLNNHPIASPGAGWDNPSSLMMNQYLKAGDYLVNYDAANPSFALMQSDGNFAIYAGTGPDFISGGALWATNTYNSNQSRYALMQSDGNFCINPGADPFHNLGGAVWCSNRTQSGGEYYLNLQADRNLVVNRNYQYSGEEWNNGS